MEMLCHYFAISRHRLLKAIDSGSVLARILQSLVEPAFFWDAFTKAFRGCILNPDAFHGYAWLLLQLVSLPGKTPSPYVSLANSPGILDSILDSSDGETRILGQKIKHILPLDASELQNDADAKPGGRHDNDHADYREISIMPTTDELLSKDRPFFRTTKYIEDPTLISSRQPIHMDNQFRLLREGLLWEIREEMKLLTGAMTSRHKGLILSHLLLVGVEISTGRKRLAWGVVLECKDGLPQLKNIKAEKRKDFLNDNRHVLRKGSMSCLLVDGEPVAFRTIHRDDEQLANTPARVVVQFTDDSTLSYALSKMKTAENIKLVQLDSAVFAFEPFLRRLQDMKDLPLAQELLHWEVGEDIDAPSFEPLKVIQELEDRSGKDLNDLLGLKKSVVLDDSQMRSLCASLFQRVSLVQGPPGEIRPFPRHSISFLTQF
jgi:hypothetical protein